MRGLIGLLLPLTQLAHLSQWAFGSRAINSSMPWFVGPSMAPGSCDRNNGLLGSMVIIVCCSRKYCVDIHSTADRPLFPGMLQTNGYAVGSMLLPVPARRISWVPCRHRYSRCSLIDSLRRTTSAVPGGRGFPWLSVHAERARLGIERPGRLAPSIGDHERLDARHRVGLRRFGGGGGGDVHRVHAEDLPKDRLGSRCRVQCCGRPPP